MIAGWRVVDYSTEIAGPYCTKILRDAGASVVKVEPDGGDPLRRWSASGRRPAGEDGALFKYLNAGKAIGDAIGLDDVDLVVESGQLSDAEIASVRSAHPHLVVVSVTPFGRSGPWRDRPATEFTLQAWCGSIGSRGTADREPVHAGGRLGEWIAGTFAAVGALAAVRAARLTGHGDHVDVAMLEAMTATMGGNHYMGKQLGAVRPPGPPRTVEIPSIEPTADGYVGFCTVTGQQFQDFLVLIERPDLIEDAQLASFVGRQARRDDFCRIVADWTTKRTTDEVVEAASAMRIPVTPIGTPSTITTVDQFVERGVFEPSADGTFVQPRVPYRIEGGALEAVAAVPRPSIATEPRTLPLAGIQVLDLTAFWAGPAASTMLGLLGADVIKVESPTRPDGMRFHSPKPPSQPDWLEWGSIFHGINLNKRGITLDLASVDGRATLLRLMADADVLIENFSPRVLDNFGITWSDVQTANPRAVMCRMPAFGLDGPWRDRTGFAQTMEQVSGMAWMTGFADSAPIIPRGPCDPLAGMHAVCAVIASLAERDTSGRGHFVESTMVEAALNVAAEVVIEYSAYGAELCRDGNQGPHASPQGVYRCAGDEQWITIAAATDEQREAVRRLLGDDIVATLAARELSITVDELLAAGVPAAPVVDPVEIIHNEHLRARGYVEAIDHPVIGRHAVFGLPMRFASHAGPWITRPAPTLGQHNAEVLAPVRRASGRGG